MAHYDKFNFVFFLSSSNDYYKFGFYDAFSLSNARFIEFNLTDNNGKLVVNFKPYRPVNNPAVFSKPFDVNSPQAFTQDFLMNAPVVFFFFATDYNLFRSLNFFNHLRDNYPECKLICWLTNPIHYYQDAQKIFIDKATTDEVLCTFDRVLTYDIVDSMNYGLIYFEGFYSVVPYEQPELTSDVFFIGRPKDRLEKILRAYENFMAKGFVCDFYINGISNPPAIKADGLHFNHFLSYAEVLENVMRSKAVLDIAQKNTYGLTMRYFESLAYNKNFITDNAFYRQDRFASPKLFLIDRTLDIDKEQFMSAAKLPNNYKNEYTPLRFISFLESILNS